MANSLDNNICPASPPHLMTWKVRKRFDKVNPLPPPHLVEKMKLEGYLDKKEALIYRFKYEDGRRYYGSSMSTEYTDILKRLEHYRRIINDDGKKKRQIESMLGAHPSKFEVAIVDRKKNLTEQEVHELEEKWQDKYDTRNPKHGFNYTKPTKERLRCGPRKKLHVETKKKKPFLLPREKKTQRAAFVHAFKMIEEEKSSLA